VLPTAADLFERHHLAIYRYLLRMTGSRETAEDLTQEVFLRVLTASSYEERDRELAWLFRIARNLRIDRLRREQRSPARAPLDHTDVAGPPHQGLRLSLQQALSTLADEERDAFVLAEVGGLSYAEIASVCGVTSAAIRSRIYRARQSLRASLDTPVETGRILVRGKHGTRI
jgi:RNA polymerase sigma-70 factor (ECF subfamily)